MGDTPHAPDVRRRARGPAAGVAGRVERRHRAAPRAVGRATGYPVGLAGSEISLAGRIVAVADVFDVITSARSYKRQSSVVEARKELLRCAGTQFDPAVVRAFLAISVRQSRLAALLAWLAHVGMLARHCR